MHRDEREYDFEAFDRFEHPTEFLNVLLEFTGEVRGEDVRPEIGTFSE